MQTTDLEWISMLMSMFVVIMALAMVMLSFYVLRTSVTWLTNQVCGGRGGTIGGGVLRSPSPLDVLRSFVA